MIILFVICIRFLETLERFLIKLPNMLGIQYHKALPN